MTYSVYMIDGMGSPPSSWYTLARQAALAANKAGLRWFDRLDPHLVPSLREDIAQGNRIIAIGHSLGCERIEQLAADRIELHAAVLIDAVRSDWERRVFDVQATHAISFTRRWFFGWPTSMGLRNNDVKMVAGHSGIITAATPSIVEFVRKAVAS